jgi:hypothetical protein
MNLLARLAKYRDAVAMIKIIKAAFSQQQSEAMWMSQLFPLFYFTCASQFVSSLAHVYYPTIRSLSEISETDRQDLLLCAVENTPDLLRMVEERLNSVSTTQSESSVSQVV